MEITANNFFSGVKEINAVAYNKVKGKLPALDIPEIISMVVQVMSAEDKIEAVKDVEVVLEKKYGKPAKIYAEAFAVEAIQKGLQSLEGEELSKLDNAQFAGKLVKTTEKVAKFVRDYHNGGIDEAEFINALCATGILDLGKEVLKTTGVNIDQMKKMADTMVVKILPKAESTLPGISGNLSAVANPAGIATMMVSVMAFAEAFTILKQATEDAAIAHEDRLLIEQECQRSIEMMKEYHEQMDLIVAEYLGEHAETFNQGIAAMDRAIVDNDINGYIKGNVSIQAILHYDTQFTNEDEFNALMDSDEAFKL